MTFNITKFISENKETFHLILDLIPIPLFIKGVSGKYLSCNHQYEILSGKSRKEMIGKTVYELWPKAQADMFFLKDKELFDSPGFQTYQADISASFDHQCIVEFHKETFKDSDGQVVGLLGAILDVTEKTNLELDLKRLAETDDLTGLPNRRAGLNLVHQLLKQSQRSKKTFVVAMLDIDNFKLINDTYGHNNGDIALQEINKVTSELLRDYDIIFRHGGEEFILCFPDTGLSESLAVLERIRHRFEKNDFIISGGETISITVSIGVSAYPQHGASIKKLLSASDTALYAAKDAGRNCIREAVNN